MVRRLGLSVILGLGALVVMLVMLREARAAVVTFPDDCLTLQACINSAQLGDTVLIKAGTYTASVTLNKRVNIIGEGAATTIIRALPNQRVMTVTGATITGTVVISGLTLAGGNITGTTCSRSCGGALLITGTARPLLQNLVISNSVAAAPNLAAGGLGGGLYVHDGSPLTLLNVTIISNTSTNNSGGGMYAASPVTLTNAMIALNRAPNGAGGGLRATAAVRLVSVSFINNHSFNPGGAARVSGPLNAVGIFVLNNSAGVVVVNPNPINGGGLRADADATLSNVRLENNRVNNNGGGIYASGRLTMSNMLILDNQAAKDGGGVYAVLRADLSEVTFSGNTAGNAGGGLFALADGALMGSTFFSNTADVWGGAIYAAGTVGLTDPQVISNTAGLDGGGLYAVGAATVSGGRFEGNRATTFYGGGVYAQSTLTVDGASFVGNRAGFGGGGISALTASVTVANSAFAANQVDTLNGAGIYAAGPLVVRSSTFTGHRAPLGGAGISGLGNTVIVGSAFTNNVATGANCLPNCSDGGGGAVRGNPDSTLDISGSSFFSNSARLDGGAVMATGSSRITSSTFARNAAGDDGGAVVAEAPGGDLTVTDSHFSENRAGGDGGGVFANTPITVTRSTFSDNVATAGGGIYADRAITITGSHFEDNTADRGGGVYAQNDAMVGGGHFTRNHASTAGGGLHVVSDLNLSGTRFVANTATSIGGGLYHSGGRARIANALFADNVTSGNALAVYLNDDDVEMLHTTVSKEFNTFGQPAAILVRPDSTLRITNTIIANHVVGVAVSGTVSGDYNLLHNLTTPFDGAATPGSHNVFSAPVFVNPGAGDYRLAAGSPAIDAGTNAGVVVDFEGDARPHGGGFDIGFDEALFVAPVPPSGSRVYLPIVTRADN